MTLIVFMLSRWQAHLYASRTHRALQRQERLNQRVLEVAASLYLSRLEVSPSALINSAERMVFIWLN